jgi:2-polyprenyl-3-methyl-5-hydroxy-6-metoxy-1,4-benzoquinol methylase
MPKPQWDEWLGREVTSRLQRRILPQLQWNQEIWSETIRQYLTDPVRWLDAGCGWRLLGKDLEALENELVSLARIVVGVDLDFPRLRKHVNLSRRICASLDSLPFSDASFDLVTCNMVVEHLPTPFTPCEQCARTPQPWRVCKPPARVRALSHSPAPVQSFLCTSSILRTSSHARYNDAPP